MQMICFWKMNCTAPVVEERIRILAVGVFSFGHKGFDIFNKLFCETHRAGNWEGHREALYRSLISVV